MSIDKNHLSPSSSSAVYPQGIVTGKQKAEKDLKKYQDQKKDLLDIFHKIEHSFEISDVWISGCSLYVLYNKEERRMISRKYFKGLQKKFRKRKGVFLYI